ncbi:hypothetical protein RAS1_41940 [Phycisphaerae bacterium RAS1]|nr:hypothetical protein RAS1_41940 [Phycisphaerae bacterium RAS1]
MAGTRETRRELGARPNGSAPLDSIGQGDFRRDYFPEDFGMHGVSEKPSPRLTDVKLLEAEVIGAALRYVAVADWFEARPVARCRQDGEQEAMNAFNRVEEKLRHAVRPLLRKLGHTQQVLEGALRGNRVP